MRIENRTPFVAEATITIDPDGRESYLLVVKGTYDLGPPGQPPTVAGEQRSLVYADAYHGDPASSSILEAYDFAPSKPMTDIVVVGAAYAPRERAVTRTTVRLVVAGLIDKSIDVTGERLWERTLAGSVQPGEPRPFTRMPLTYERAFGGQDTTFSDASRHRFHRDNLVGCGLHANPDLDTILGTRVPNLAFPGHEPRHWNEIVPTAGFAFVCPHWTPRIGYAGTYDQAWMDQRYPFLPDDFDERYHQAAPGDQIVAEIRGGEAVLLQNMHPDGMLRFALPQVDLPVRFLFADRSDMIVTPKLDTVVIWADEMKLSLVWRARVPVKGKLYALRAIVIGHCSQYWLSLQRSWKPYFKGVSKYVEWKSVR